MRVVPFLFYIFKRHFCTRFDCYYNIFKQILKKEGKASLVQKNCNFFLNEWKSLSSRVNYLDLASFG